MAAARGAERGERGTRRLRRPLVTAGSHEAFDGTVQVTYDKWPLYTWVVDSAPGDVTGQDLNNLGGKWYVITPKGQVITKHL